MTDLALPTRTLQDCEAVIERGLDTFVEVGEALLEIRDARLYHRTHGTFEDYCRERWGFDRTYAHRHIQAAEVASMLPIGNTPTNESVARELAPLRDEPDQLRDTWAEVVELHGERPTAANVREVVAGRELRDDTAHPQPTRGQLSNQAGGRDDWSTPQDLFDRLDSEFRFDLDVCALPSSAKCERYFTPEVDGLAHDWRGTCWMNPPYGEAIGAWVRKAYESAEVGATVVCLVPARVDTGWWWDYCRHGEVRFLRGRLKFGSGLNSAPFPSAVVVFGRPACVKWWER